MGVRSEPPRSLRRNVGAALAGNVGYTLSQFLLLLAVVRLTDTETVGRYALALAITAPIFIFAGLKMRHVQVTDAAGENTTGEYVAVRLLTSLGAIVVTGIVALALDSPAQVEILMAVCFFKAAEAQVDVLYGTMQRHERMDMIARSMLVRALFATALFVGTLWFTASVPMAVTAIAVLTTVFVFVESRNVRKLSETPGPRFPWRRLIRLSFLGLPLGVSVSVGSLSTNVPRYLLQAFGGPEAVGVFATLAYILVALGLIGGSAAEAASPRMAALYQGGDVAGFVRITRLLALFGLAAGTIGTLLAITVGKQILGLLFGRPYAAHSDVLTVLALAATVQFLSLAVGTAVYALRQFKVQVPVNILGLTTVGLSGFLLIRPYGLLGAAGSVLVTQGVLGICYLWIFVTKVRHSSHFTATESPDRQTP